MLRLRSATLPRLASLPVRPFTAFGHYMVATDPGLLRLTLALRGTLSVALMTAVAVAIGRAMNVSIAAFATGIVFSMMGPFLMRETTLAQQRRTMLTLLIPSTVATAATTLLHGHGLAGEGFFLLLVFLSYLFQTRAPRMIGVGLMAVITSYVGLFLQLPLPLLPYQLLAPVLASVIIALVCFVLLPVTPSITLRRAVRAVQGRAAQVLANARGAADESALRRDLTRLNEAVLAADDQLAFVEPDGRQMVRKVLLDLELATARLVEAVPGARPGRRHALRLRLHEARMRRGRRYVMPVSALPSDSLLARLVELGHAVHRLGAVARETRKLALLPASAPLPPGPLAWRLAFRITLAAMLAMAGGMALSPQRWFWAVITVYVVFLNTRSRGDTIYKGMQRVGGTLLGILAGLLVATSVSADLPLQLCILLLSVFGMYYFYVTSYVLGVFFVTLMLGMVYGSLGVPVETLFVLRLEETAIGAAAAILVAAVVFPTRTRDQVMRSGRGVLLALAGAVKAIRERLAGQDGAAPAEAMRQLDRQVADLRLSLAPLVARRRLFRRNALERPVPVLLDCVQSARVLAAASQEAAAPHDEALVRRLARIEALLSGLANSSLQELRALPAVEAVDGGASGEGIGAQVARLEIACAALTERLQIGAFESFALDA